MRKNVTDPEYWKDRMYGAFASGERHRLMFNGSIDQFENIERRQAEALKVIRPCDSVIDVGCGYGRLLHLLSHQRWRGSYVGFDVSPDLIGVARKWWPGYSFVVTDLADAPNPAPFHADWAVALWVKSPLVGNGYGAEWDCIEAWMRLNANNVLIVDE